VSERRTLLGTSRTARERARRNGGEMSAEHCNIHGWHYDSPKCPRCVREEALAIKAAALDAILARLDDREWIGRLMHESWSATKRAQGFHHPSEPCPRGFEDCADYRDDPSEPMGWFSRCGKVHPDLIPWDALPEKKKDINRHAFDALAASLKAIANAPASTGEAKT
jgi:hypothetical protein